MVSFCSKKLEAAPTISELLKSAREEQNIHLKIAAEALQLSPKYLQALEDGHFQYFPGEIYIKNFIKKYASYLNLNGCELLQKYLETQQICLQQKIGKKESIKKLWRNCTNALIFLRQSFVALVAATLIFYIGLEFSGIFKAPTLTISSPEEGMITSDADIEVSGLTLPETKVQINGTETVSNDAGNFQEKVSLNVGTNKIVVTAFKKHGKSTSIIRNVIFKDKKSGEVSLGGGNTLGN